MITADGVPTSAIPAQRPPIDNLDRKIAVRQVLVDTLAGISGAHVFMPALPALLDALEPHLRGPVTATPADHEHQATPALTERMIDVLHGLARGLSLDEIGAEHGITGQTARSHRMRLFRALGVHSGPHAVARGYQLGILR